MPATQVRRLSDDCISLPWTGLRHIVPKRRCLTMSQNVPFKKNRELALALAGGMTMTAAAEQFGISRKTIQRKLAKSGFRRLVADGRNQMIAAALGRSADQMTRGVDALVALL